MKTLRNILLLLAAMLFIASCDKREFDLLPTDNPVFEYAGAITTIQDLKAMFRGQSPVEITTPTVIHGWVVANDISGNLYQRIHLQDETAGIEIRILRSSIFNTLPVGQEIFLECQGLYYGEYGGYPQIGFIGTNAAREVTLGLITWNRFRENLHLSGFPNLGKVEEMTATVSIDELMTGNPATSPYIGKLVKVTNVEFQEGGSPFAVPRADNNIQTENKMLISATGTAQLTARNSSAANFASLLMPAGVGNVTGVLSIYTPPYTGANSTLQITFRDSLDVSPTRFINYGKGTPVSPWTIQFVLDNQDSTPARQGWIQGYIVGAIATGVNSTNPVDDNGDISFAPPFFNTTVVLAASPNERDWTKCVIVELPNGSDMQNQVNLMDTPANLGKWLQVNGKIGKLLGAAGLTTNGTSTDFVISDEPGSIIFNETLLTQESYGRFTAENVTGTEVWTFSSQYGAMMSGFASGASHENEDWFISPALDLTGKSSVMLSFDHARGPAGSINVPTGNYTLWISTDYVSGKPSAATWTELAIPTHGTAAWSFVSSGNIIFPADKLTANTRFAFKYVSNSTESATWEIKNVLVR